MAGPARKLYDQRNMKKIVIKILSVCEIIIVIPHTLAMIRGENY